jgi:hypothetical protein
MILDDDVKFKNKISQIFQKYKVKTLILGRQGEEYVDYYFEDGTSKTKVLPTNSDLDGLTIAGLGLPFVTNNLQNLSDQGVLFLTNYSSGVDYSKNVNTPIKRDDYGIYVKMFTDTEYSTDSTLVDTSVDTNSVINLESLSKDTKDDIANSGFNVFGGIFGIQDFGKINFGSLGTENTPARYVFYKDSEGDKGDINGLCYSRKTSGEEQKNKDKAPNTSILDFKTSNSLRAPFTKRDFLYKNPFTDGTKTVLHLGLGSTVMLADRINGDSTGGQLSYPYIEQMTNLNKNSDDKSFSLFGSKFYYLQNNAKCISNIDPSKTTDAANYVKALLFLNTLPFNMEDDNFDPFAKPEIKHLFDVKGGFIHAPRLWVAYVGGVLWWMSNEDPFVIDGKIVGGGRGKSDPVTWKLSCSSSTDSEDIPFRNEFDGPAASQ